MSRPAARWTAAAPAARVAGLLLLLLLAAPAAAQERDPLRLEEMTVEASPIDRYLPARTHVDRDEIIDSRKSELSAVLELTPGINVRQGGRGEMRVDMRGFDQRAILFTLNGVPVYEPYNGIINVDLFPLEMLGGIDIVRGASSSLYGPNGMAGQIQLDTFGVEQPLAGAASAIWRQDDFWDLRVSGGGRRDEGLSVAGAGRYVTAPNFPLSGAFGDRPATQRRGEDGGARQNSDLEQSSGFLSLGYEHAGGRAHAAVLGSQSTFGIPPSTIQFSPFYRRVDPQRLLHAQAGVEQRLAPAVGLAGGVFTTLYDSREREYADAGFDEQILQSDARSREVGGIGRLTLDLGSRNTLAIGGQVRGDGATISTSSRGALSDPDVVVGSVAAEDVFAATDWISLIAGLSYDVQGGGGSRTRGEVNPQGVLFVDWSAWGVGATRAAIGRKLRFPTLRELFDPRQGNPDLRPETTVTYEIGQQIGREWGYAALNLFRSDVDDLIESGGTGGDPQQFRNLQTATFQGVELATGVEPLAWLRLDVNYTYLNASTGDEVVLRGSDSAIQHRPAHRFNGILQLVLPWELLLRMEGLYTSEQLEQLGSDVYVDDFGLWNVQLSRPVGEWLTAFVGCDNLLDADWEQKLGTPEAGRRAFAGLRASY